MGQVERIKKEERKMEDKDRKGRRGRNIGNKTQ
jgi:hypothetical protein